MGSIPSRREPAAVIRAQLDCTPAQVMTLSLPLATASARMKSSFRALLPPKASPVWSSRLTKRRGPPSSAARVGISSNGVGRWASGLPLELAQCLVEDGHGVGRVSFQVAGAAA